MTPLKPSDNSRREATDDAAPAWAAEARNERRFASACRLVNGRPKVPDWGLVRLALLAGAWAIASVSSVGCGNSDETLDDDGAGSGSDEADDGKQPVGEDDGDGFIGDDDGSTDDGKDGTSPILSECARESFEAQRAEVSLFLLLDASGSMRAPISMDATRWDAVTQAIRDFIASPESTGLNLALNYFPVQEPRKVCETTDECAEGGFCVRGVCDLRLALADAPVPCEGPVDCPLSLEDPNTGQMIQEQCVVTTTCDNDPVRPCIIDENCADGGACSMTPSGFCSGANSCDRGDYMSPAVEKTSLPGSAMALIDSLDARTPDAFALTPTHVALEGAYFHTETWFAEEPDRQPIVVLATDGFPEGCFTSTNLTVDTIRAGATAGMKTFVIGVVDDETDGAEARVALNTMAQAGRTNEAQIVTADDTTATGFLDALSAIRGEVLPCDYQLPEPEMGAINFDRVNVELSNGGDVEVSPRVDSASDCDDSGGWHYDVALDDGRPENVVLCPKTCETINSGEDSQVDIVLGCQTVVKVR